jgi:hypothetical protein
MEIEILTALNTIHQREAKPTGGLNTTCNKQHCKTCKNMKLERFILDHKGTKLMTLPFKCTAKDVVYCLTCNICHKHYVGYTSRKLKDRLTTHRSSIKMKGKTAVAKHFNQADHLGTDNFEISILDASENKTTNPIKIKEASWIAKLNAITEGINERDESIMILGIHTEKIISHFNHSKQCWPYIIHHTVKTIQDNMSRFKRVIINKDTRKRLPTLQL